MYMRKQKAMETVSEYTMLKDKHIAAWLHVCYVDTSWKQNELLSDRSRYRKLKDWIDSGGFHGAATQYMSYVADKSVK